MPQVLIPRAESVDVLALELVDLLRELLKLVIILLDLVVRPHDFHHEMPLFL